ncbi:hypothetical protein DQ04_06611060, partial [Trypanosoma grayi]|uniref:hypothetical protein n=1 Tax=Trypanosoma grayi TaxID=71804 RepID=UPI0004F3F2DD
MMAAVGRPALFVVAVALWCVCGCAAAPDVSDRKQRKEAEVHFLNVEKKKAVLTYLNEAKKKALKVQEAVKEARSEVDGIKKEKAQMMAEVNEASTAAIELNKKVKMDTNLQRENIGIVIRLAGDAESKSDVAYESFDALLKGVAKILNKISEAEKLAGESELASSDAATEANTNVVALAEEASEKAQAVMKWLSQTQDTYRLARNKGAWKEYSRYAAKKAKELLQNAKKIGEMSFYGNREKETVQEFAETLEELAAKAVGGAEKDLNAAYEIFELVKQVAPIIELWLNKIDIALDAVENPKTESNPLSTSGKPSRLPVPAPEASHG